MTLLGADPSNPPAGDAGTTLTIHEAADRIAKRSEALAAAPAQEPRQRPTAAVAADEPPAVVDEEEGQPNGGEGAPASEAPAEGDGTAEGAANAEAADPTDAGELDLTRKVKVRIAGKEVEVPLSEALAGYSREADYRQKTQALATDRRAADEAKRVATEAADAVKAERQFLANLITNVEQRLYAGLPTDKDMAHLRETDPPKYLLALEDIRSRQAEVEGLKQVAARAVGRNQEEATRATVQTIEEAHADVMESIPELRDRPKAQAFATAMHGMMTEAGFTSDDVARITDPRVVKLVHRAIKDRTDAEAYRKLQARAPATEQRVAEAPRVARPGTAANAATAAEARLRELRNRAAKTGTVNNVADLIAAKSARR